MNHTEHHGDTPAEAAFRRRNEYDAAQEQRDEAERVAPPAIYRNRMPHLDEAVFGIIRAEVRRWRLWASHEYNRDAWMTESRTFTEQQRAWLTQAADRLEQQLAVMNATQEDRS